MTEVALSEAIDELFSLSAIFLNVTESFWLEITFKTIKFYH